MEEIDSNKIYRDVVTAVINWLDACNERAECDKAFREYPKLPDNPIITDAHGIVAWERYLEDREHNLLELSTRLREADGLRTQRFSEMFSAIPYYDVWFKTPQGYVKKIQGLPHVQYKSNDEVMAAVAKNNKSDLPF